MPTQTQTKAPSKSTGAKKSQTAGQQTEKQGQPLPSVRAVIDWVNPNQDGKIRATGRLTIGGAYVVHGVKVARGSNGDFVSMPSYKKGDEYKDIFHAVTKDARDLVNNTFMKAYEQKLAEQNQDEGFRENEAPADEPAEAQRGQGMKM